MALEALRDADAWRCVASGSAATVGWVTRPLSYALRFGAEILKPPLGTEAEGHAPKPVGVVKLLLHQRLADFMAVPAKLPVECRCHVLFLS